MHPVDIQDTHPVSITVPENLIKDTSSPTRTTPDIPVPLSRESVDQSIQHDIEQEFIKRHARKDLSLENIVSSDQYAELDIPGEATKTQHMIEVTLHQPIIRTPKVAAETIAIDTPISQEKHVGIAELVAEDPEIVDELVQEISDRFSEIIHNPDNLLHLPVVDELPAETTIDKQDSIEIPTYSPVIFKETLEKVFETPQDFSPDASYEYTIDIFDVEGDEPVIITELFKDVEAAEISFIPHLETFFETESPEICEEATEVLQIVTARIESILENVVNVGYLAETVIEIEPKELDELIELCIELVEYLGYRANEENAKKLLAKMLRSSYALKIQELAEQRPTWLEELGTHEQKFHKSKHMRPNGKTISEILHRTLGQYAIMPT